MWKRIFIAAHVLRRRAPREVGGRWEQFWAGVRLTATAATSCGTRATPRKPPATSASSPSTPTAARCRRRLWQRSEPRVAGAWRRPLACCRALATAESAGTRRQVPGARTRPRQTPGIWRDDVGDANVFVRGVLHILEAPVRRRMADNIGTLVGARGRVLIGETNHRGHPSHHLERAPRAGPRGLPSASARAISTGIPAPSAFGDAELEACSRGEWRRLLVDSGMVVIAASASTSNRRQSPRGKHASSSASPNADGGGMPVEMARASAGREPARACAEPFQVAERVAAVVGLADQHPAPRADERADVVGHPPPGGHVQDVEHAADEHVGVAARRRPAAPAPRRARSCRAPGT